MLDCRDCVCYDENYPLKCRLDLGCSDGANTKECPLYLKKDDVINLVRIMCPDGIIEEKYIMTEEEIRVLLKGGTK